MLIAGRAGFYVTRSLGRLEQCRLAAAGATGRAGSSRPATAVEQLRRAARIPLLRAHYEVSGPACCQVQRRARGRAAPAGPGRAGAARGGRAAVAFEAARVRAFALRDLGVAGEAERQARLRPVHRARAGLAAPGPPGRGRVRHRRADAGPERGTRQQPTSAVALGRFRQRLDAIEQVGRGRVPRARPGPAGRDRAGRDGPHPRRRAGVPVPGRRQPARLEPRAGRSAAATPTGNDLDELAGYSASTVERVRRTGEPLVLTSTEEGEALGAHSVVLHGLRSIMVAPLQLDGRLLGVVYLDSRVAKGIFTADDVGVLIAITNHIAVALETARAAQLEVAVATANRQRDLAETLRDALAEIAGDAGADAGGGAAPAAHSRPPAPSAPDRAWLVLGPATDTRGRGPRGPTPSSPLWRSTPAWPRLLAAESHRGRSPADRAGAAGAEASAAWLAVPLLARRRTGWASCCSPRPTPHAFDRRPGRPGRRPGRPGRWSRTRTPGCSPRSSIWPPVDDLTGIANRRHFFVLAARELARVRGPPARRRPGRDDGRHRPLQEDQR